MIDYREIFPVSQGNWKQPNFNQLTIALKTDSNKLMHREFCKRQVISGHTDVRGDEADIRVQLEVEDWVRRNWMPDLIRE